MKFQFLLALTALVICGQGFAATSEVIKLKTPRGASIEVEVDYPAGSSPAPALVIGPGQGYHMDLPLVKSLAEKVVEMGYVAIRFNWHYFSEGKQPSDDLAEELEDYSTVVNFAKVNPRVNYRKIILAGKSLGSLVSYNYFKSDPSVKALVLMTPVCTWRWDDNGNELSKPISVALQNYPQLLESARPVVVAMGNRDSLCTLPMLFDFLKDSSGNIATIVVEGNHSMDIGQWDDPVYKNRNAQNYDAATNMISHWVRLIVNNL